MRSPRSLRRNGIERGSVASAYVRRAHNAEHFSVGDAAHDVCPLLYRRLAAAVSEKWIGLSRYRDVRLMGFQSVSASGKARDGGIADGARTVWVGMGACRRC